MSLLIPGYCLLVGSSFDRALLVQMMEQTYQEMYPEAVVSHLSHTVAQYLSSDTPLWWVRPESATASIVRDRPIACLWLGNAIDQVGGDRHAHIFLLYVDPQYRRQGIGTALLRVAEDWARERGDRQIGLQVFLANQPALNLYQKFGFQTQSLWMVKSLNP